MGISLTGRSGQARAAKQAAALAAKATETGIAQVRASGDESMGFLNQAGGLFSQFQDPALGQQLTDPQAQFDFLQNNPLFDLALQNANQQTGRNAAAGGRLSFGSTAQDFSNNVLQSAFPLLQNQQQNIRFGQGALGNIFGQQADLSQQIGSDITNLGLAGANAEGAGRIGAANIRAAGKQQLLDFALMAGGAAAGGFGGGAGGAAAGGGVSPAIFGGQQNALLGIPGNTLGNTQTPGGFGNVGAGF